SPTCAHSITFASPSIAHSSDRHAGWATPNGYLNRLVRDGEHLVQVVDQPGVKWQSDQACGNIVGYRELSRRPPEAPAGGRGVERDVMEYRADAVDLHLFDEDSALFNPREQEVIHVRVVLTVLRNDWPARHTILFELPRPGVVTLPQRQSHARDLLALLQLGC